MKPNLTVETTPHYIANYDMVTFIQNYLNLSYNDALQFGLKNYIFFKDIGVIMYSKKYLNKIANENAKMLLSAFFEQYPFLNMIAIEGCNIYQDYQ